MEQIVFKCFTFILQISELCNRIIVSFKASAMLSRHTIFCRIPHQFCPNTALLGTFLNSAYSSETMVSHSTSENVHLKPTRSLSAVLQLYRFNSSLILQLQHHGYQATPLEVYHIIDVARRSTFVPHFSKFIPARHLQPLLWPYVCETCSFLSVLNCSP